MSSILPILIGGLILFLFAMTELSSVMKSLFSEKARKSIERYTSNIFSAILLGILFTILLGSSSAVIIIVIVLINSKALSFKQAIGIILGANIGTTFSSQIIALDIGEYAIIPMILGLFIQFLSKNEKKKGYGKATFHFGLLFFGLFLMQESVAPLQESPVFETWIANAEGNALSGALIGGLITLIIQSSSGTVGMAIVWVKKVCFLPLVALQ